MADIDDDLVRVYREGLRPTHQKHAIDLMANARQVQLLASLPGRKAGLGALEIADDGTLAFALGGVICVTHIKALDELPGPAAPVALKSTDPGFGPGSGWEWEEAKRYRLFFQQVSKVLPSKCIYPRLTAAYVIRISRPDWYDIP